MKKLILSIVFTIFMVFSSYSQIELYIEKTRTEINNEIALYVVSSTKIYASDYSYYLDAITFTDGHMGWYVYGQDDYCFFYMLGYENKEQYDMLVDVNIKAIYMKYDEEKNTYVDYSNADYYKNIIMLMKHKIDKKTYYFIVVFPVTYFSEIKNMKVSIKEMFKTL